MWCADMAMYRAKLSGEPYAVYGQGLDRDNQLQLADDLRMAIEEQQLVLHYQTQLDLRSNEILGVEALLRWKHPQLGMIPPLRFLPLAEEAGLMGALSRFVLDTALAQCASWRADGRDHIVSVNISPTNLLEPGFSDVVRELLALHKVPSEFLVLEVTETCIISDFDRCRVVIEELRAVGIVFSIDDFGAGATSLEYLGNLGASELKLDVCFIQGLSGPDKDKDLELVRATIELGHAMGLRVVAEGIEDAATLDLLIELGCDVAQGYFISRPMPADILAFNSNLKLPYTPVLTA
jgi:EAL domain-containing protein (putative c-di-GMP-specific phosphodiesterase class I)